MKVSIILWFGLILGVVVTSCRSEEQLEFARYYSLGSVTYQNKCQNCHGKNGEGLGALIPPLNDTNWFKAHQKSLSCVVKHGLSDTINIKHKTFAEKMPPVELSPVEIAGVLTYVTNSFGNNMRTVTAQLVENDMKSCK